MQTIKMTLEQFCLLKDFALFVGYLTEVQKSKDKVALKVMEYIGQRSFSVRKIDSALKQSCDTHLQVLRGELYFLNDSRPMSIWRMLDRQLDKEILEELKDMVLDVSGFVDPESELYKVVCAIAQGRITRKDLSLV